MGHSQEKKLFTEVGGPALGQEAGRRFFLVESDLFYAGGPVMGCFAGERIPGLGTAYGAIF